jgi:hypothetical protein
LVDWLVVISRSIQIMPRLGRPGAQHFEIVLTRGWLARRKALVTVVCMVSILDRVFVALCRALRDPAQDRQVGFGPFVDEKFFFRLQLERDYPLNLSILVSGGKETN